MLARKRRLRAFDHNRIGFTLIEILIVLVIIAILAALILPAVNRARMAVRIAEVNNEMNTIKTSITQFKVTYGIEPPSSITIHEFPGTVSPPTGWNGDPRSRRYVKQIWPQFDFTKPRLFNDDTDSLDSIPLDGAECLVFFLGGMVDSTSGALRGFSKNPRDPFIVDNASRSGPFFEFKGGFSGSSPIGRLVDTDGDGAPEYLDTLPGQINPYVYFSSYGGAGYRNADNTGRITAAYFKDGSLNVPYNRDSFQIISPGQDYEYGLGGVLDNEDKNGDGILQTGPPPNNEDTNGNGALDTNTSQMLSGTRVFEKDNIANFHSGELGDKD